METSCVVPSVGVTLISEEMEPVIKNACTIRLKYIDCLNLRNAYTLLRVVASWTLQLDYFLKLEVSLAVKATKKELDSIQTHVLADFTPLCAIMESQEGTSKQTLGAVSTAVQLLGYVSA